MVFRHDPKVQLIHQLENFYAERLTLNEKESIDLVFKEVINKLDYCFNYITNKYYHWENKNIFNPFHTVQWLMFLYRTAHELRENSVKNIDLCDKIYGISKIFSSADIYYEVNMPNIWFCDHPQGSVMGRALYSDFFTFSQGCTVGNNKGRFPIIGKHVSMLSNSKILGNCTIGDYVILAANTYILDRDIPAFSLVFGSSPDITIKPMTLEKFNEITGTMFADGKKKEGII